MAEKIEMPQLSDTMESGKIVKWFVEEGDSVERGDVLAEVETDKATMDLEAFDDGILLKKMVQEGEEAPTQSPIAIIGEEGEDISELLDDHEDNEPVETDDTDVEGDQDDEETSEIDTGDEAEESEISRDESPESTQRDESEAEADQETPEPSQATEQTESKPSTRSKSDSADGRLRASPVARRMAADNGIDLSSLEGSGPEGRIIKKDVKEALEQGGAGMASVSGRASNPSSNLTEDERPLSGMRKTIAERMSEAKRTVPHFYLEQTIDMEQILSLVESLRDDGREVNLNDFVLMGAARAMNEVPRMNASYREDHVKLFGQVDLGFAVAVEDGLFTPVIPNAETRTIDELHKLSQELIEKTRSGDLKPEEYQGATFTVSNLGMFDIPNFSAVINPPEAGILAVGKAEERPVAEDGTVQTRKRMSVTLSCDHRAVDGAIGARYLRAFKKRLENPGRLYT
jgi:pyruvate dehydrogenase E2 component (dihydrolipoamide acetyltransferase)